MESNPFVITGYTVVANSGGKTSGYNLWLHLQANGSKLPDNARCVFTNTGWEDPRTLDFLEEQSKRWSVRIHWLQFAWRTATEAELATLETKWQKAEDRRARLHAEPPSYFASKRARKGVLLEMPPAEARRLALDKAKEYAIRCHQSWRKASLIGIDTYREVNRATAAVNGEPFDELLTGLLKFRNVVKGQPGVLPNGVQRICTGHLKVRSTARFASDIWPIRRNHFDCRLGLRADEENRVNSAKEWGRDGGKAVFPLYEAGIDKADVARFWAGQPFRLPLKSHEGNCGGCHMKRREALMDLIRRDFFPLWWWKGWEVRTGQTFRKDRTYHGLEMAAEGEQSLLPPDDFDNAITCEGGYCTD